MSEFKFACPVCGQHITADPGDYGARIECPTCFQKILVPQAPTAGGSTLILTATQPHTHHFPLATESPHVFRRPFLAGSLVTLAMTAVVVAGGAWAWVTFHARTHEHDPGRTVKAPARPRASASPAVSAPPANSSNWTLELEDVAIPESQAAGRINGRDFICTRAMLLGGMLILRQGGGGLPPEFGWEIMLGARQSDELAGQTIIVATNGVSITLGPRQGEAAAGEPFIVNTNRPNPSVTMRWRDGEQMQNTRTVTHGYAMLLEFGRLTDNRMPAKIYLCLPDGLRSYVAGTMAGTNAVVIRPPPPRLPQTTKRG